MIHVSNVSKHYGTQVLYRNASFQINRGEKIGLVGPNGAGKSTIFRLIVGEERADEGIVNVPDKCVVGYFSQNVGEMSGRSVLEEVMSSAGAVSRLQHELVEIEGKLAEPMDDKAMEKLLERYGEVQSEFEKCGGYELETRAKEILTGLGIGPDDFNRPTQTFSGGWKMRIELAKILVLNPDVLLMDEPTNHLDMESIIWLESWLMNFKGAILMTSHDRDFMNRLVNKIIEVANKTITTYSGNYDFYERERTVRRDQLIAAHARQQDMLAKEEEFIARFAARASHAAQVQSRVKKLDKIDRIEIPAEEATMDFEFPTVKRSGDVVVKIQNLKKVYKSDDGREKLVFSGATATVNRLDKIAVVGVNGAGKSTLLKIISEQTDATEGVCQVGASVTLGYFSQNSIDILTPSKTVMEELHDRLPNASVGYIRNLLAVFLFRGDDVDKKISILSGGEKSRIVLAIIFTQAPNFLVLDEPTNHLDIASREMLLKALKNFEGTLMIVSHDRYFLRGLVNRVFELDKHHLQVYEGNFEYYTWKKKEESK